MTRPAPCRLPVRRPYRRLSPVGQRHALSYAARTRAGEFTRPSLSGLRLPAGYRAALTRDEALGVLETLPSTAGMRCDSLATRRAVWAALVEHLHPETGLAIVGQEVLARRASVHAGRRVARSTVGNHLRALEAAGALHVAQSGAAAAVIGERDRAPSYVILLAVDREAPVDELGHLPEGSAYTRVVDITLPRKTGSFSSSTRPPAASPQRRDQPGGYAVRTSAERRIAVAWLAATMGWAFQERTEQELVKITGPWFAAGWTPRAVLAAWHRQPDGLPWPGPLPVPHQRDHPTPPRIRNLWAVLTYRLAGWRDAAGRPLPAPVPAERPVRGRPVRPASPTPLPAVSPRSATAEAALASCRARLAARAEAIRVNQLGLSAQRRRDLLAATCPPVFPAPPPVPSAEGEPVSSPHDLVHARALRRARIERLRANQPIGDDSEAMI